MPAPHPPQESPHHLLVPFASASAPECQEVLHDLDLPHLQALLAALTPTGNQACDELTFTPPHERVLAQVLGIVQPDGSDYGDGQIPWAAARSREPLVPQAWLLPCHFAVATGQVSLVPGEQLGLTAADSRPLMNALAPFCLEDGIQLEYESATRWRARGEPLRGLACASLDRASGRSVADWAPTVHPDPASGRLLQRLQSETQMLFYTHPVNDAREAARLSTINGFWVEGAGVFDRATSLRPSPTQVDTLRQAALRADWGAWRRAWLQLDANLIKSLLTSARRGEPVRLTLCGERVASHWDNAARSLGARASRLYNRLTQRGPAWKTLETL